MNNIQQFLEEEYKNRETQSLVEHDTRLINFVLSEVEKEVEKKYEEWKGAEQYVMKEDILKILNNLRVKTDTCSGSGGTQEKFLRP